MFPKNIRQGSFQKTMILFCLAMLLAGLSNWNAVAQKGIIVDGKKDDWLGIQPIIDDPKDMKNERVNLDIKAVYAALNEKNLYLMIETYEAPSRKSGYSFDFDVNNDGTAEYYARFGNMLDFYHDGEGHIVGRAEPIIYDFRRLRIFRLKYVVGEVVEARVPLDYLGNPYSVSIGAQTNVWNLYHEGQNLSRDCIDSACCGKIDIVSGESRPAENKEAGWGMMTVLLLILPSVFYFRKKREKHM